MSASPPDEAPDRPSLAGLVARVALSVLWLGACAVAAATLLHGGSRAAVLASAALLICGPVVWLLTKAWTLARSDEAHASVKLRALTQGLLFALAWPGAMIGGGALSSLLLGAGEVNVNGMMQNALTYLAIAPPVAFFLSEVFAFAYLLSYSRPPRE